jgi:DNA replication protein DnaC
MSHDRMAIPAAILAQLGDVPNLPSWLDQLPLLPPTTELQRRVQEAETALEDGLDPRSRRPMPYHQLRAQVDTARRDLVYGQVRDLVQQTRPEGCTCLGTGKRYVKGCSQWCACPEGQAMEEAAEAAEEAAWQKQKAAARRRWAQQAKLPQRYKKVERETAPDVPGVRAAHAPAWAWWDGPADKSRAGWDAWYQEHHESALFYGPVGTGKTCIAIAMLKLFVMDPEDYDRDLEDPNPIALFLPVPDLLDMIKRTFNRAKPRRPARWDDEDDEDDEPTTETGVLDLVSRVPFLVLDDLGAERPTAWVLAKLYQVISRRHSEQLATIFTSNFSPRELLEHFSHGSDDPTDQKTGERLVWRIVEMADVIKIDGPNLRERTPPTTPVDVLLREIEAGWQRQEGGV